MTHLRKLLPLFLFTGFILAYLPPQLAAQSDNRAALVVNMGGGNVQTKCVSFPEEQITGYDLLQRSGLGLVVEVQGAGALVCSIDGIGCPAENCLCQCAGGSDCVYWSYWHKIGGNWQYSAGGSSSYPIKNGMVDGWSWGPGASNQANPPPNVAFEEVCQVPATPTATAVPATDTPIPTDTPVPEISFSVDATTLTAGACTHLRWQTANISAVYLNGGGVIGAEVRQVCPTKTESYGLRVVYPGGEETRTLTVNVVESPLTVTPTAVSATVGAGAAVVTTEPTVTPKSNATPTPAAVAAVGKAVEAESAIAGAANVITPLPAAVTPEINWMIALPQPTKTEASPADIAALPPTPPGETIPAEMAVAAGQKTGETAVPWSSYIGFLIIALSLGLLIVYTVQKNK